MNVESGGDGVLSRRQYDSLLDAAETYREALVVRLCGDVGLRPAELARLTIDDVEQARIDPPRYLVRVPPAEETRDGRTAYLPTRVERELRRYARSNDLSPEDRIFSVTPRRLQMLVSGVTDRAAELFDDPSLADISTGDLRHYFAHRSLVERGINPRVVKAAGGWRSFEALESYLPEPTEAEIVDAFEAVERPSDPRGRDRQRAGEGANAAAVADDSIVRLLLAASDRYALVRLDEEGYVERWNRSAAAMFDYRASEIVGTHVSAFYPDDAVEEGLPERVLSAALEESGYEVDGCRVRKDGSTFRATEVVSPLRDDRGRHTGFALFVRDVSSYYDELETLRQRRTELERRYTLAWQQRALTESLLEAADHEAVETETCETLVRDAVYEFAWIDRTTMADRRRNWRVASGIGPDDVDRIEPDGDEWERPDGGANGSGDAVRGGAESGDGASDDEIAVRVAELATDGEGTADVPETLEGVDGGLVLARVPLAYGETTYGTLTVAAGREPAFDADERAWLETIGRQVGYAITAVRRRNLLLSDRVVEFDLTCRDDGSFLVAASDRLDCRFELDSLVPTSESTQLYYLRLEGAEPAAVFDLARESERVTEFRLIETYEDGWRVEFVVEGSLPLLTLSEYGVTVRGATIESGTATITGECAGDADLRTIVDGFRAAYPDSELVGKREAERTVRTAREFREGLEDRLTDRQIAALRAAYFGGYYDWPRESTAEEVADAMGISSPTLHNHLRKGQHELLRTFFDYPSGAEGSEPVGTEPTGESG
ncbi:bacterio-opsin activator domain-containing protein [Halobiforma nitratireducens]|uniref:PAS/PAC sensor protein n=1 Tax=Halobiforma nitratireducens JCM 10879 TaxID=1227454 RepID=M0MB63_9EURY|nr:bacterio-opsin activator domain-containing protein [Halobiforma nitratireducens]EMA42578.1 PAS/PAC sensor protein [Halobiforma nitratireducens JCM 10879]